MATWKKILVSGSDIDINRLTFSGGITASDMTGDHGFDSASSGGSSDDVIVINSDGHFLRRAQSDVQGVTTAIFHFTGSDVSSASFDATGDTIQFSSSKGGLIINVDSSSDAGVTAIDFRFKERVVSSSVQIASEISGAFDEASGSISTHLLKVSSSAVAFNAVSESYALSSSIIGTANEIFVSGNAPQGVKIGLPEDVIITGSLIVSKSVTADTLTLLGMSLIDNNAAVISGSNVFGSDDTNRHVFTGSIDIRGGITASITEKNDTVLPGDLIAANGDGIFVKAGTAITDAISSSFNAASESISTHILNVSSALVTDSASISTHILNVSSALVTDSGSISTHILAISGALSTLSGSVSHESGALSTLSGSVAGISGALSTLSSSVHSLNVAGIYLATQSDSISVSGSTVDVSGTASFSASGDPGALTVDITDSASPQITYTLNTGKITASGDLSGPVSNATVVKIQGTDITSHAAAQLGNIDASEDSSISISEDQWGYVGNLNQNLSTSDNVEFSGLKVGTLQVTTGVTNLEVTNLNVDDQFILLNSHSAHAAGPGDGGIIVQLTGSTFDANTTAMGTALYYDNGNSRWALAGSSSNVTWNATDVTADAYVASVRLHASIPTGSNPIDFGTQDSNWYGMMHVNTNAGDDGGLYIYLPD